MQNPPGSGRCGLVSYAADGSTTYLSLKAVSANVHIVDVFARVILKQLYVNESSSRKSTYAQYIFPIPASGAVCAFKMQTSSGQVVRGVVKELAKAKKEYEVAISNNQWAGLLYEATPDVFVISMGAIPMKENVEVTIMYVQELKDGDLPGDDQVQFSLQTYIASRYGPAPSEFSARSSSSGGAIFTITAEIQMISGIKSVSSSSHSIKVGISDTKDLTTSMYKATVILDPKGPASKLDRDFILDIQSSRIGEPYCIAEKRSADRTIAMSLTFVPQIRLERLPTQEYIFLIDRSGSMSGSSIAHAKEALLIFFKSLPPQRTSFNIFSFGSSWSSLWSSSQQYTSSTRDRALAHVNSMGADMGGTEIKNGLENTLKSRNTSIPTSVFLLTDGEVHQLDELFALVTREVAKAGNAASGQYLRIFTLGVGDAASTALCEGVARNGHGLCLMTAHSADISQKCVRLLSASMVPPLGSMGNVEIDWGYVPANSPNLQGGDIATNDKGKVTSSWHEEYDPVTKTSNRRLQIVLPDPPKVQQAPTTVPDLYPKNRFIVSVILSDTTQVPKSVTLRGTLPDGSQLSLPPVIVHEAADRKPGYPPLIHTLAAHKLILELENNNTTSQGFFDTSDEKLRDAVIQTAAVRFSETYQLASKFASFIAIDERTQDMRDDESDSDSDGTGDRNNSEDTFSTRSSSASVHSAESGDGKFVKRSKSSRVSDNTRANRSTVQARRVWPVQSAVRSAISSVWSAVSSVGAVLAAPGPAPVIDLSKSRSSIWSTPLIVLSKSTSSLRSASSLHSSSSSGWSETSSVKVAWIPAASTKEPTIAKPTAIITPTGVAVATNDAARLQRFDGSFALDEKLSSLVSKNLSIVNLKSAMPSSIRGRQDAETVWATVLAAAYMKVHLASDKHVWTELWRKAAEYVKLKLGDEISFASLVDEASKLL